MFKAVHTGVLYKKGELGNLLGNLSGSPADCQCPVAQASLVKTKCGFLPRKRARAHYGNSISGDKEFSACLDLTTRNLREGFLSD